MGRQFVDTSALVKLYRNEPLTAAVQACIGSNDQLVLCGIACSDRAKLLKADLRLWKKKALGLQRIWKKGTLVAPHSLIG